MANTFSSRNTLKTKLLAAINAANSADMIVKLSRSIEKANLDDDADLETALDTKVSALAGTASTEDIEKLAFGVKKLRTPEGAGTPTSTMVAEGSSNLYVTQDRVRGSFSASGDLSYDSGTGVLSYTALPDALTVYATVADLPASGVAAGAKGIVEENKKLYVFTGASWVGVGLVDQKPSFDSNPDGSYALTPGGDTVITLSATDPQGDAITYSHQVTAGSLGGSSVSQSDNVFTITGSTNPADTAPFSITFSASDGTNVSTTTPSEFTISFGIDWNNLSYSLTISGKPAGHSAFWGRRALQIDDDKILIDDFKATGSNGDQMGRWWVYDRVGTRNSTDLSTNSLSNGALGYDFSNAIHSANDWDNNWSYINDMYPYFANSSYYPDQSMLAYGTQKGKMRDGYYFAGHIFGMDGSTGRFGGINGYDISTGEPRFSLGNPASHSYFGHPSQSGNNKYEINKYEWGKDFDVILNHPTLGYNVAVVGTSGDHGNSLRTPTEDTPRLDYKVQGKLYVMQFTERGASSNPTSSCVRTIWNERARSAGNQDPEFAKGSRGQGGSASAIAISPTTSQVAVGANQAGGGSDQIGFEATNTIHDYNTQFNHQTQTIINSGRILVYNLETGDLDFQVYHTQTYPLIPEVGGQRYGGRFGSSVYAEDDGFISLSCLEGSYAVGGKAIIVVSKFSWNHGSEIWTWKNTDEPGNSALNSSSSNIVYDVKDGAMAIWHDHAGGYLWVLDTSTGTVIFGGDSNQNDAHAVGVGDGTVLIGRHNANMTRFDVD